MIDRVLDTWPVRRLVLIWCWLEDRTYGYVRGGYR
jgi:hypothetical protein